MASRISSCDDPDPPFLLDSISGPERINPCGSRAIASPSQSVCGSAPLNINSALAVTVSSFCPLSQLRRSDSSLVDPMASSRNSLQFKEFNHKCHRVGDGGDEVEQKGLSSI